MIELTNQPIDVSHLLEAVRRPEAGAVVLFLGVARQFTGKRETVRLSYEAYAEMASKELERLDCEARQHWNLAECAIAHRLGEVPLGEESVAIAVSSPHRSTAFEAGQWLINTLKQTVPIWKQEHWTDGGSEWVHPQSKS